MSSQAIDFSKYEEAAPASGQIDFSKYEESPEKKEEPGFFSHAGSILAGRLGMDLTPEDVSSAGQKLGEDLTGMGKAAFELPSRDPNAQHKGLDFLTHPDELPGEISKENQQIGEHYDEQKKAGYGLPYRIASPVAEGLGVNVRGMEQSAAEGDRGGVLGHAAAVPAVMAATEGIGRGVSALRDIPTVSKVAKTGVELAKGAGKVADVTTFERAGKIFNTAKNTAGKIGDIWKTPEAEFPGAPLPETPAPELLNPSLVSESRTLPGQIGPERISGPRPVSASPIPPREGLMLPAPRIAPPSATIEAKPIVGHLEEKISGSPYTDDAPVIERFPEPRGRAELLENKSIEEQIRDAADNEQLSRIRESRSKYAPATKGQLTAQANRMFGKSEDVAPPVKYTKTPGIKFNPPEGTTVPTPSENMTPLLRKSLEILKAKRQGLSE